MNDINIYEYLFPEAIAECLLKLENINSVYIHSPIILPYNQENKQMPYYPSLVIIEGKGAFYIPSFGVSFNIIPDFFEIDAYQLFFSCVRGLHNQIERYFVFIQADPAIDEKKLLSVFFDIMESYLIHYEEKCNKICILLNNKLTQ